MSHPILSAKNIKKRFTHPTPIEVLSQIDLDILPGDSVAIMGRSGEGKSTLLQILGTLDTPTEGTLQLLGKSALKGTDNLRNRHIGFVFQQFNLLEDFTALENVMMPARIGRKDFSQAKQKALEMLELVGLKERAHHFAKQLSGGEKQRVSIARAFFNDPDIILADEPTGNLDKATAEAIHTLLLNFAHDQNKALLLVTHDPELARLCKKQYTLSGGCLTSSL
ncbi:MAG: ABC transporter ATP-binding protein [Chlamydiia bacterium]|nr:ABC transporter ATP-binding protein [Chlamydiia bacterium]